MPSYRATGPSLPLSLFDVVGQDGAQRGFVGHAGLAQSPGSQGAASIPVIDMQPPLHGQDTPSRIRADVVGTAVLTDDEVQKIRTFVDRHTGEHLAFSQLQGRQLLEKLPQVYCVYPHVSPLYEDDGRYARTRFSCAGFVLEAYKKARIRLLDLKALPSVDTAVLALAYPREMRLIEHDTASADTLGLEGSGPWPVLLCGYLFHALNRDPGTIRREPYPPTIEDRYFH